jgi:transcriptional regulator with XRE-family HTH domain
MLKDVLKEKNISQADLAEQLGLTAQVVSQIVNGKKKVDEVVAVKIADILEASVPDLFTSADIIVTPPKESGTKKTAMVSIKSRSQSRLFILEYVIAPGDTIQISQKSFDTKHFKRAVELRMIEKVGK